MLLSTLIESSDLQWLCGKMNNTNIVPNNNTEACQAENISWAHNRIFNSLFDNDAEGKKSGDIGSNGVSERVIMLVIAI
jgi:hypothetical protein